MLSNICFWMILFVVVSVHTFPSIESTDTDLDNPKDSETSMIERIGLHQYLFHHPSEENLDEDEIIHNKRQLKKKWTKLHQGNQSPYTIAFPALIRTRRDMEEKI